MNAEVLFVYINKSMLAIPSPPHVSRAMTCIPMLSAGWFCLQFKLLDDYLSMACIC